MSPLEWWGIVASIISFILFMLLLWQWDENKKKNLMIEDLERSLALYTQLSELTGEEGRTEHRQYYRPFGLVRDVGRNLPNAKPVELSIKDDTFRVE